MSENFNYQFTKIPTALISDNRLSATEFRIICVLLNSSFENFNSYLGYERIANETGINKRQVIYLIKSLENKGYISKEKRNNGNKSNLIHLNFDDCGGGCQNMVEGVNLGVQKNAPLGVQENAPSTVQKNAPHSAINCTLSRFKYQDLNIFKKNKQKKVSEKNQKSSQLATADIAAVRSMPTIESAKKGDVDDLAAKDQEIAHLWRSCLTEFKDLVNDLEIIRVGEQYGIRKISKYALENEINAQNVKTWLENNANVVFNIIDTKTHYIGEIAIRG